MTKKYVSPLIEVVEVEVEQGFAVSVDVNPEGFSHDFSTVNFNSENGNSLDF
jgi:hypothetical protein